MLILAVAFIVKIQINASSNFCLIKVHIFFVQEKIDVSIKSVINILCFLYTSSVSTKNVLFDVVVLLRAY